MKRANTEPTPDNKELEQSSPEVEPENITEEVSPEESSVDLDTLASTPPSAEGVE